MDTPLQDLSDDEIVADMFRLARTGEHYRIESLLAAAQALYPDEPAERIRSCAKQLAKILWNADYQGMCAEYSRHKRSRRRDELQQQETHG